MKSIFKFVGLGALVTFALALGGCASPAQVGNMQVGGTPEWQSQETFLRKNLAVQDVTGGQETNPLWTSEVSSGDFKSALENSLKEAGLYAPLKDGKYRLIAHMEELDQPLMGLDLTVTARVNYILYEQSTGKELYNRTVALPYTAKVGDAFAAVKRLRLANEGAVRVNIEALLNDLFKLKANNVALN